MQKGSTKKRILFFKTVIILFLPVCFIFSSPAFGGVTEKERIAFLKEAALEGDVAAQFRLGFNAFKGIHQKKDFAAAEKWFRMAAAQDHGNSLFGLAVLLEFRMHTFEEELEVAALYKKAADKGVKGALYKYGTFILTGKAGIEKNVGRACELLEKAADQKHADAKYSLIELAHKKQYPPEKGRYQIQSLEDLAKKGDVFAQYRMGQINEYGYLIAMDHRKAAFWYKRAAAKKNYQAAIRLAYFYENGDGVAKDVSKAIELYRKALEKGYMEAAWQLASLYENGVSIKQDHTKAAAYYQMAAKKGHLPSMTAYGHMLAEGRGIAQNDADAARWLTWAAERGDANAQYFLGMMYKKGLVPQRPVEQDSSVKWHKKKFWRAGGFDHHWSMHWFEKAAAQGHKAAMKEFKGDISFQGWAFLVIGILSIPYSIAGYFFPEIMAAGRNPFAARFVGAPFCFLFGIFMIVEGIKLIGLL